MMTRMMGRICTGHGDDDETVGGVGEDDDRVVPAGGASGERDIINCFLLYPLHAPFLGACP